MMQGSMLIVSQGCALMKLMDLAIVSAGTGTFLAWFARFAASSCEAARSLPDILHVVLSCQGVLYF